MSLQCLKEKAAPVTLRQLFNAVKAELLPVCNEDAGFEARQLIQHILDVKRVTAADYDRVFPGKYFLKLQRLVDRRIAGEPLQYLIGSWEFMGLPFLLNASVLIPRQDTETLAEAAIRLIDERKYACCLDTCTGSGCIAISVKKLCRHNVSVTGWDIAPDCIAIARQNARLNEVSVDFGLADLFSPNESASAQYKFDIITANPPYIPACEMECLQAEVRHEPALALYGGQDGLDFYRRIAEEAGAYLNKGGTLLLEVGINQAEAVQKLLLAQMPCSHVYFIEDLCHIKRVVALERL